MKLSTMLLNLGFIAALSTAAAAAFATDTSINFPIGQKNGTFNCVFDGSGSVIITTDNVKVRGFCPGDPNVPAAGQLHVNSDAIKDYYFAIEKSATQSGKITVAATDGDLKAISCTADQGGKQAYPYGSEYCAKPA